MVTVTSDLRMMPRPRRTLQVRFRKALARLGQSQADWLCEAGVSKNHLWMVFRGEREPSERLLAEIRATIDRGESLPDPD
jgi:transcriptional regulator with XRE-family HTH domain